MQVAGVEPGQARLGCHGADHVCCRSCVPHHIRQQRKTDGGVAFAMVEARAVVAGTGMPAHVVTVCRDPTAASAEPTGITCPRRGTHHNTSEKQRASAQYHTPLLHAARRTQHAHARTHARTHKDASPPPHGHGTAGPRQHDVRAGGRASARVRRHARTQKHAAATGTTARAQRHTRYPVRSSAHQGSALHTTRRPLRSAARHKRVAAVA